MDIFLKNGLKEEVVSFYNNQTFFFNKINFCNMYKGICNF